MSNFLPFGSKTTKSSTSGNQERGKHKRGRSEKPSPKQLILESLEDRLVLTSPQLLSIVPSGDGLLRDNDVLDVAPSELVFQFDNGQVLNEQTLQNSFVITRSVDGTFGNGNDIIVTPGFIGLGESSNQVVVRFADTLPDDSYRIRVTGALRNMAGEAFNNGVTFQRDFVLDLAPRVVAVVPQPIDRNPTTGAIIGQRTDQVDVYFSNGDPLTNTSATDPRFYQLIDTRGTQDPSDDAFLVPVSATYNTTLNRVTLDFGTALPDGTYRLRIGSSNETVGAETLVNVGSLHEYTVGNQAAPEFNTQGYIGDGGVGDSDGYSFNLQTAGDLVVRVTPTAIGNNAATLVPSLGLFTNEVQRINLTTLSGGSFTLTFNGQTTGLFGATPTAAEIKTLLEALSNIGAGNVLVTDVGGGLFDIMFVNALGFADVSQLTASNSVTVTTQTSGSVAITGSGGAGSFYVTGLAAGNYAVRITGQGGSTGAYTLEIDFSEPFAGTDANSSIGEANTTSNLGNLGSGGIIVGGAISNSGLYPTTQPGSADEPGQRELPIPGEGLLGGGATDLQAGINTIYFYFPTVYGTDPNGNTLLNVITENQKERAREIFAIYGALIGAEFVESQSGGDIGVVTGDIRAVGPTFPPTGVGGIAGGGLVVMNALFDFGQSEFGGNWQQIAFHEVGHALGLGHAYHLPGSVMGGSETGTLTAGTEPIFPGDYDIAALRVLYAPESRDIDLYKFDVTDTGMFTAESFAERLGLNDPRQGDPDFGLLDTVLSLFDSAGNLLARNDDYFSSDSFLEILLQPGTYYIGVTSTGNTAYDPRIIDSGYGGVTEGAYDLRLNFVALPKSTIVDTDGVVQTSLDGDADGTPGGDYNFWFQVGNTLFVDKADPTAGGNGSIANPYNFIDDAVTAASNRIVAVSGDKINDGDTFTISDGLNTITFQFNSGRSLFAVSGADADGRTFSVNGIVYELDTNSSFGGGNVAIAVDLDASAEEVAAAIVASVGPLGGAPVVGNRIQVPSGVTQLSSSDLAIAGANGVTGGNTAINFDIDATAEEIADAIFAAINASALSILNGGFLTATDPGVTNVINMTGPIVEIDVSGTEGLISVTSIIRILGNITNTPYLIGLDNNGFELADGASLLVPQGVTLMIDAGAIFKLQDANIDAGSSQQGVDRSGGSIQVLGTPDNNVYFTSFRQDTIRSVDGSIVTVRDDDGQSVGARPGDWGGLVFREDSDLEQHGIFLSSVNNAELQYGGGTVIDNTVPAIFTPIHVIGARPAITYNAITFSADAAISADPNSFEETHVQVGDPNNVQFDASLGLSGRRTRADYNRVGLDISSNTIINNSINGLFIRISTPFSSEVNRLTVQARFDDTDITHVLQETLFIDGQPGGPLRLNGGLQQARLNSRLAIDGGVVVKLGGSRIEVEYGGNLIAEGSEGRPVVFTSIFDDSFGAGGVFDTNGDLDATNAAAGDWGGIYLHPTASASIDHAYFGFGGGTTPIEGGSAQFNVLEARQANLRVANSIFEFNAGGRSVDRSSTARNGRGANEDSVIFVRGSEVTILNNIIRHNEGSAISIDVNSLSFDRVEDIGRSTGAIANYRLTADNQGALVRYNKLTNNDLNGMVVRGGIITTQGVWDDTDIVHIVFDEIQIPNLTTYGGLRIESGTGQSLVVKLSGANAGFTATGTELDIDDRIGGSIQVLGRPGFPVVFTSLSDDTVGAGFDPNGNAQVDTNNDGVPNAPLPGGGGTGGGGSGVGQFFTEGVDAGQRTNTAKETVGIGQLFGISGQIVTNNDVDLYRIYIDNPALFSATVSSANSSLGDSQLYLFDANGRGVYANDTAPALNNGLHAQLPTGSSFGPISVGFYYLAISSFNNEPVDLQDRGIFTANGTAVAGPNPGVGSLDDWDNVGLASGTYLIHITGARFATDTSNSNSGQKPGVVVGENGDAGALPFTAQTANGPSITGVNGSLNRIGDVDVYKIYIANPIGFSATTVGQTFGNSGKVDTQLFLFDSTGKAVIASGNANGTVESAITAVNAAPLLTPGYYYLAITSGGTNPLDLAGNPLFNMTGQPSSVIGNSGTGDVRGWTLFGQSTGTYTIQLTGVGTAVGDSPNENWWHETLLDDSVVAENRIVTTDAPGNHIVTPGSGYDGVARLIVTTPNGQFIGSGALLTSGRHVLTAAHVVTDSFGVLDPTTILQIRFETPQGNLDYTVTAASIFVHPSYDGSVISTNDIAIIDLGQIVPTIVDRYDITRSGDPLNQTHTKVGYGASGTGTTGSVLAPGTKRFGQNTYDSYGEIFNGTFVAAGTLDPGSVLLFDFDNGNAGNDALGVLFGINNTGIGTPEANSAGGDSGGPTFVGNLIAGVTSFGITVVGTGSPDINGLLDSSFGEISGDVSTAFHAAWIDSIVGVPGGGGSTADLPAPGDWRSIKIDVNSADRNVGVVMEAEAAFINANDINRLTGSAQFIGDLAKGENDADDNLRVGFEVHGAIAYDSPSDIDVYSFTAAGGTEVWIDIDRTDYDLDTVIEIVNAAGVVLARSDNSINDESALTGRGLARELEKSTADGEDFYGTNPLDAGFRAILPGASNTRQTYYVRVRSKGADINNLTGGQSRGEYQLQIRTRQIDEFPGSVVAFADIRYATNGVEVIGQPQHSPLLGGTQESSSDNNAFANAEQLGNLLTTDRNSLSVGGSLSSSSDVDWYQFQVDYDLIQAISGVNGAGRTFSTIFDIDYADGLARADTTIAVFDSNGNLILVARDSNVEDDQETGGVSNQSAGSFSQTDPFIGPAQLPEGDGRTYYVAVMSNATLPSELDATFFGTATNALVRLEPINSIDRIVEDHIGFAGYAQGNNTHTAAANSNPLFGTPGTVNNATALQTHSKEFTLADVTLFYNSGRTVSSIVDPTVPLFQSGNNIATNLGTTGISNITMRPDGVIMALSSGTTDGNSGNLLQIDPSTGAVTNLGDDGIAGVRSYQAIAFRGDFDPANANYDGWPLYAIHNNVLERLNPRTGAQVNPSGSGTAGPVGPITIGGIPIVDSATGMAFIDGNLFVVTNTGRLLLVNRFDATATEVNADVGGAGISGFRSLTRGPRNLQDGAFYNTLFAVTTGGALVAMDTAGNLLPVFPNGATSVNVGVDGIAFTTLDYNLWHTTLNRRADDGHGINQAFDFSREEFDNFFMNGADGDTLSQTEGGASWYFGLEANSGNNTGDHINDNGTLFNQPDAENYRFRDNVGLSNIYKSYELPGGAKGSLVTNSFSLSGYTQGDEPTLYFNYFLETQDTNSGGSGMRDAARVFVSTDGGVTWQMVATNNSVRDVDGDSELPAHATDTVAPSNDSRQRIQELFDNTGEWRQARVDLSEFAGSDEILLRFDFTTSGSMNEGTPGDSFGNYSDIGRNLNNAFEGFYVDDILVGLAERGEMVTGSSGNTDTFQVPVDPAPGAPAQGLTGSYQLEIRRGSEYGANINGVDPDIFLFRSFNSNDLLQANSIIGVDSNGVVDLSGNLVFSDGDQFRLNTTVFEFDLGPIYQVDFATVADSDVLNINGVNYEFDSGLALEITGLPADGSTFTLDNGINTVTFEFTTDNTVGGGNVAISILGLSDTDAIAIRVANVINGTGLFGVNPSRAVGSTVYARGSLANPIVYAGSILGVSQVGTDGVTPGNIAVNFQFDPGILGQPGALPATAAELAQAIALAVNNVQGGSITASADGAFVAFLGALASTITEPGALTQVPGSDSGVTVGAVPINILLSDTAANVAQKIATAVNGSVIAVGNGGIVEAQANGNFVALANLDTFDLFVTGILDQPTDDLAFTRSDTSSLRPRGDKNSFKDQGHVQIHSNSITYSSNYGILVDNGPRDSLNVPFPGGVASTPVLNPNRIVPNVLIENNVIAFNQVGGLLLSGDPNPAGAQPGHSPYALVVNNTFYGDVDSPLGIGVLVEENATPTLVNNIFANLETGVVVDNATGGNAVILASLYQGNSVNVSTGNDGSFAINLTANEVLFINPGTGNFYLQSGSRAIDSSLNTLVDRPEMAAIKASLGIAPSPIQAPTLDVYGQTRQDDPNAPSPPGLGSNVFKDRGAVERADFDGPRASLINPEDNDSNFMDLDPTLTRVLRADPTPLSYFEIQLKDSASGIDDSTVIGSTVRVFKAGVLQVQGLDYLFSYDSTNNVIRLTAGGSFFASGEYIILVNNTAFNGIKDLAGNRLFRNQIADEVRFTINLTDQAPVSPVTGLQAFNLGVSDYNGSTIIAGTLAGSTGLLAPGTRYQLVFESLQSNTSNTGTILQLGTVNIVTDGTGNATFFLSVDNSIDGEFLRITVLDDFGVTQTTHTTNIVGPNATSARAFVSALVNDMLQRDRLIVAGPALEFQSLEALTPFQAASSLAASSAFDSITVANIYTQLLGRAPTTTELQAGTNSLQAGASNRSLRNTILVSNEFFNNQGGGSGIGYINAVYSALLGRLPTAGEQANANLYLQEGGRQAMVNLVLGTPEYNDLLVARMYTQFLGRPATGTEIAQASAFLDSGSSEDSVLARILGGSIAATGQEYFNSQLITSAYRDYLQRDPTTGEFTAALAALKAGQTEAAFRANLLATLEFYNNSELDGVNVGDDEEFVRDLFRDVLGQPNPDPAAVTAQLALRSGFTLTNDVPGSPQHVNWRLLVAQNLVATQRNSGLGPLAVGGNNAPFLLNLSNQVVSHNNGVVTVDLDANDFDGDALTFSVQVRNNLTALQAAHQLRTTGNYHTNLNGIGEKWIFGNQGNYFLLSNGNLYLWLGSGGIGHNRLIAHVGTAVYNDPTLLTNASNTVANVQLVGTRLVVQPNSNFVGSFTVDVTANDGAATATTSFQVMVQNSAPSITPIADQVTHGEPITIDLNATDNDGDSVTYSATVESSLAALKQAHNLHTTGNYHTNLNGVGDKWIFGNQGNYFLLPDGNLYLWLGTGGIANNRLIANVGTAVYANPTLLLNATNAVANVQVVGSQLVVQPLAGFVGPFTVKVTATDGAASSTTSFKVTVQNQAPVIDAIADQTVSRGEPITVDLGSSDADGDPVTYSATIEHGLYTLKQAHNLHTTGNYHTNLNGVGEKWIFGNQGNYFLLPNGNLHLWLGSGGIGNNRLIANVGTAVYENPALLHDLTINLATAATVQVVGSQLVVTPPAGFVGPFSVKVTANDGNLSTSTSFKVLVTNNAPTIEAIADQTVEYGAPITIDLAATDVDGDDVTYSASIVHSLFSLKQAHNFRTSGNYHVNLNGVGDKWIFGNQGNYFLLPNGNLYLWLGTGGIANNRFIASVGTAVYENPALLHDLTVNLAAVANVQIVGSQLVIQVPSDFVGPFTVVVNATDGASKSFESFDVTVMGASAGGTSHDPHGSGNSGGTQGGDLVDTLMAELDDEVFAMFAIEDDHYDI